jgi:hypothetical protein
MNKDQIPEYMELAREYNRAIQHTHFWHTMARVFHVKRLINQEENEHKRVRYQTAYVYAANKNTIALDRELELFRQLSEMAHPRTKAEGA